MKLPKTHIEKVSNTNYVSFDGYNIAVSSRDFERYQELAKPHADKTEFQQWLIKKYCDPKDKAVMTRHVTSRKFTINKRIFVGGKK